MRRAMNKKQKILTLLALILFGAIVFVVGNVTQSMYHWTSEFFEEIRAPLFVVAVFYIGIFFMLANKDKTK